MTFWLLVAAAMVCGGAIVRIFPNRAILALVLIALAPWLAGLIIYAIFVPVDDGLVGAVFIFAAAAWSIASSCIGLLVIFASRRRGRS